MWTPDDGRKKYISYTGPLPARLYRYRSVSPSTLDRLIDFEIADEAIFLAALRDLNDPDEGRFKITFGTDYENVLSYWREAISATMPSMSSDQVEALSRERADHLAASGYSPPDHLIAFTRGVFEKLVRVACFTTLPTNYSMWANYAKHIDADGVTTEHAGICIEYLCEDGWRSSTLHPVEYSDEVPEINAVDRAEEDIVRAMYCKSLEWQCEKEWRITSVIDAMPPFPENLAVNSKIKLEGAVIGVIFGLNTPDDLIQTFRSRLQSRKPEIAFRRIIKDIRTFQRKVIDL